MGRNLVINGRNIGDEYAPLVIPEIGINHGEISSVQSK